VELEDRSDLAKRLSDATRTPGGTAALLEVGFSLRRCPAPARNALPLWAMGDSRQPVELLRRDRAGVFRRSDG